MRGERVCASRSHSEKSSGRPPPKSTSLRRKKTADGNLRRGRHSERPLADRLRYVQCSSPSSAPLLFSSSPSSDPPSIVARYVRTYARYVRTYAWWAAPPREDALIDLGRRTRIAHRGSQLNDNARYAGYVPVRTRCEGHAFENRCCRMNDIASQIQRKEERQELT